jgi:hypothetical protein
VLEPSAKELLSGLPLSVERSHDVAMPVIALTREVGAGMAIHAARVLQNGQHLREEGGGFRP